MLDLDRLAFVDVETTGLSCATGRITEIGVVTADGPDAREWTTLLNPGIPVSGQSRLFNGITGSDVKAAPGFREIAADLHARLAGRVLIAHNARFDFGFLKAEFGRAGLPFDPPVVCSVMLSRKLFPDFPRHDLDSLIERYSLDAGTRHRALPDARVLWGFWNVLLSRFSVAHIHELIDGLLAGPVLPPHLDPALIDRLPDAPGVYVLHGEDEAPLHVGKAGNLRLHLVNYFRTDRISKRAWDTSTRIHNITWRVTRGPIGANLRRRVLELASIGRPDDARHYTWRFRPDRNPCLELIALSDREETDECYGMFRTERIAKNALHRLLERAGISPGPLGILAEPAKAGADGASVAGNSEDCIMRLRELTKVIAALKPWRISDWPYQGPVGLKERGEIHIIHGWRYLGTAQNQAEISEVLESRPPEFDEKTFSYLSKVLSRIPQRRIVEVPGKTLQRGRAK